VAAPSSNEPGLGELSTPIAYIVLILFLYWFASGFVLRRYRSTVVELRALTGPNAALVLATLAIARLLFDLGLRAAQDSALLLLILVAFGSAALLAVWPRTFAPLIGIGGLIAFWVTVFAEKGVVAGLWFLVVSIAMLIFMAILRPLARL
jgi:hypothetical protein